LYGWRVAAARDKNDLYGFFDWLADAGNHSAQRAGQVAFAAAHVLEH
jgi:nucleoside-specific outer membrane channel protein Tsx